MGLKNIFRGFLGALLQGPAAIGLLGQTSDPTVDDGTIWYRSDADVLKLKSNGSVKTLLTTEDVDYGEAGDVASVAATKAAGSSDEFARADHVHDLGSGVVGTGLSLSAGVLSVAESYVRQQTTTLTNAQVLALRATPITVVTAPGAGKFVELVSVVLVFDRTAAYTESADNLAIKYVSGSGSQASATIETTGFLDASGDAITSAGPNGTPPIITSGGELSNAALVIHNTGDGEYGGGNASNTIKVIVTYRVHTTGL